MAAAGSDGSFATFELMKRRMWFASGVVDRARKAE